MKVLAFDRDWTVDVNPHPNREAVPLEWVRYWAHATDHEVWAIGNQDLVEEAVIPGTVESILRRDGHTDVLGEQDDYGYYEWWPERDARLQILAELFPDAEEYIVVDDLDLSHVDGWDHYHAWNFMDAIRAGDIGLETPPSETPLSDGGFRTKADVEQILDGEQFFELTYQGDGQERTYLVSHREPHRPAMTPLKGPPTFHFDSIGNGDTHSVRLPDVVDLRPVPFDGIPKPLTTQALRVLGDAAESDSEELADETVHQALQQAREQTEKPVQGLRIAFYLLKARDGVLDEFGEEIFSLLTKEKTGVGGAVITQIRARAQDDPTSIEPYVSELAMIVAPDAPYRTEATQCLMEVAEVNPTAALDGVPVLATAATADDETTRSFAVYTLAQIADEYPEEVYPAVDALIDAISADDDTLRTNALSTLGKIASSYPDAAESITAELAALLGDDAKRVRNNAVGLLGDIAQQHPDVVIEYAEQIAERLTDQTIQARVNASIALLNAGEANPAAVEAQHEYLEAALDDASPEVRANACLLIANTEAPVSVERLRELAANDLDETVRERAAYAVEQLS